MIGDLRTPLRHLLPHYRPHDAFSNTHIHDRIVKIAVDRL